MAQPRITLESGNTYHIWTHANGNENLFRCDENFRYFLRRYQYYIHPVVETFAYCLMPNHLHLMIRVRKEDEILEFVRKKKDKPNLQGLPDLGGLENSIVSQQFSNLFSFRTVLLANNSPIFLILIPNPSIRNTTAKAVSSFPISSVSSLIQMNILFA